MTRKYIFLKTEIEDFFGKLYDKMSRSCFSFAFSVSLKKEVKKLFDYTLMRQFEFHLEWNLKLIK